VADKQSVEIHSWQGLVGDGTPGPGRPRGTPNRWTAEPALQMAFDRLGGVDGLVEWGRKNPADFYRLYARLATSEPAYAVLEAEPEIREQET